MKLFGKNKKPKECSCCSSDTPIKISKEEDRKNNEGIKILGSGCAKCKQLEKATIKAISELNLDLEVEHVTDFSEIASYGVMTTPALVLDREVLSYGKVLKTDEIKELLKDRI